MGRAQIAVAHSILVAAGAHTGQVNAALAAAFATLATGDLRIWAVWGIS